LLRGSERPSTATGEVVSECYLVVIPEIRIGTWTGYNWSFLVRLNDDEKRQLKLLFDTDSMRFFNWVFDFKQGICEYIGLTDVQHINFNQMKQYLNSIDGVSSDAVSNGDMQGYWLINGQVFHTDRKCSGLKNSATEGVKSGLRSQSGKSRCCAKCES
jgi:hypothetical protein